MYEGAALRLGVNYAVSTRYKLAFGNTPKYGSHGLLPGILLYEYLPYPYARVWVLPLYYSWLEHVSYDTNKNTVVICTV
jgi:hypothetical protein